MRKLNFTSVQFIPLSFFLAVAVGTLLLMLPCATLSPGGAGFMTALFTATSSVCVTGLAVVNILGFWSLCGQIIILVLIQIGGLGIITVISMLMLLVQRKFSLHERLLLQDALNLNTNLGVLEILVKIIRASFLVEILGAILYAVDFVPRFGWKKGLWCSFFNSVSAFCNAGMDILGTSSLEEYRDNPYVLCVTMFLIVMGSLGYVVWFDISSNVRNGLRKKFSPVQVLKRFSEHTKLVLFLTAFLILFGAVMIFIAEFDNPATLGSMKFRDKLVNSFFQSITLRTAGFSTFSQKGLSDFSCVVAYILMFIGGSPIGTAGGIKTVTFFLAMLYIYAFIRGNSKTVVFKRNVDDGLMRKASVICFVSMFTVIAMMLLLLATNKVGIVDALYETISACATVGLTRDLTPSLNVAGKIIIVFSMYLGRIGPISLAVFFAKRRQKEEKIQYSNGNFYVG